MNRSDRIKLIERIQEKRNSKLMIYITGDRTGMETKIAMDLFPMIHKHLTQIGSNERTDLFLYSTGGTVIAGYALVNLFREFCNEFNVIIPFKALSCATLIALGANHVIMTKMGQLSPIDPSVGHPLGPIVQIPGQPGARIAPVNVEDVNAFFELAKKEAGLSKEESMRKVFEILASHVHPLVLGAIQRSRAQIAFLASALMKYHVSDDRSIRNTVEILTRERFSHDYIISRQEAKKLLGLKIIEPDPELDRLIIDLFGAYNDMLMIDKPYNPESVLGIDDVKVGEFNLAIIESTNFSHVFRTKKEIKRVQVSQPNVPFPMTGIQERLLQQEWIEDDSI